MKIKQKRLPALFITLLFVLQGCGGNKTQEPAPNEISGQELTVVSPFGDGDGYQEVYRQLITSFQDDTGCIVNDRSERSSEKWKLDVLDSFGTDEEPDIVFFFTGAAVSELVEQGKFVDLGTIRQYDPNYAVNINLSVLNTMKAKDGLNYCVPVTGFWEGLYINQDVFEEYNIAIPSTLDELLDVIETFNSKGIIPVAANLKSTPHYWFEYMLYNYTGPSVHNTPVDASQLKEYISEGLQMLKVLFDAGAFPEDIDNVTDDICMDLFVGKEAAMMLDGSWAAASIEDRENVQIAYIPSPSDGARKSTDIIGGFSMGYYITQKAWDEKRDAALAFVKSMTGEQALAMFNMNGSASPAAKAEESGKSPFILSTEKFIGSATAFVPAMQDSFDKEAREYLFSNILDILKGEAELNNVIDEFIKLNT